MGRETMAESGCRLPGWSVGAAVYGEGRRQTSPGSPTTPRTRSRSGPSTSQAQAPVAGRHRHTGRPAPRAHRPRRHRPTRTRQDPDAPPRLDAARRHRHRLPDPIQTAHRHRLDRLAPHRHRQHRHHRPRPAARRAARRHHHLRHTRRRPEPTNPRPIHHHHHHHPTQLSRDRPLGPRLKMIWITLLAALITLTSVLPETPAQPPPPAAAHQLAKDLQDLGLPPELNRPGHTTWRRRAHISNQHAARSHQHPPPPQQHTPKISGPSPPPHPPKPTPDPAGPTPPAHPQNLGSVPTTTPPKTNPRFPRPRAASGGCSNHVI